MMHTVNTKNLASYLDLLICQRPQLMLNCCSCRESHFFLRKQNVLGNFTKIALKLPKEPQIQIKQSITWSQRSQVLSVSTSPLWKFYKSSETCPGLPGFNNQKPRSMCDWSWVQPDWIQTQEANCVQTWVSAQSLKSKGKVWTEVINLLQAQRKITGSSSPWRQGWGCSCCCKCLLSRPLPPMCNCNCFQGRELRCVFLQSQSWLYILTTLSKKRCLFVFLSFSTLKFRSRNPRRKECPWSKTQTKTH